MLLIQFAQSLFADDLASRAHHGAMKHMSLDQLSPKTVCGQAHAVLESLARSRSLPGELSISIEEILERAWEIAYRKPAETSVGNVIEVPDWAFRQNVGAGSAAVRQSIGSITHI